MNDILTDILPILFQADTLIRLAFGVLIGLVLGMTGVGGGVLIIPILQIVFGMEPVLAVGTASLIATFVKIGAGASHIKAKNVAWKETLLLLAGAVPVVYITATYIVRLNNNPEYKEMINSSVQVFILGIMALALMIMVKKMMASSRTITQQESTDEAVVIRNQKTKGVGLGAACGFILGSTGIGGGVMILPALNSVLHVPIKKSVGSSIVIALALSAITALSYSKGGQSDVVTAIILVVGSYIGVPVAIKCVQSVSDTTIYKLTVSILTVSLLLTAFK